MLQKQFSLVWQYAGNISIMKLFLKATEKEDIPHFASVEHASLCTSVSITPFYVEVAFSILKTLVLYFSLCKTVPFIFERTIKKQVSVFSREDVLRIHCPSLQSLSSSRGSGFVLN